MADENTKVESYDVHELGDQVLTDEEMKSLINNQDNNLSSSITGAVHNAITKDELDAINFEFLNKKKKEVEIIEEMYREHDLSINSKYINILLYSMYAGRLDSQRGMHLLMQALQPDLLAFFEAIYDDLKFDLRSDYKDLEYLWINTESIIRAKVFRKEIVNYETILGSAISSINELNPYLVHHESDSKENFEDERQEYREEHGLSPRI